MMMGLKGRTTTWKGDDGRRGLISGFENRCHCWREHSSLLGGVTGRSTWSHQVWQQVSIEEMEE